MANEKTGKSSFWSALKEFIEGAVVREPMLVVMREKGGLEKILLLLMFGDILGIPISRSYYSLRILPYVVPLIVPWKRGLLKERDWTDSAFD
jgi:hypothetical protein